MEHDYIEIDTDSMPYSQQVELADNSYIFKFYQNPINGVIYIDLYDYSNNLIQAGEPLLINQPLWRNINKAGLPIETLIPLDESNTETEVTMDNLGQTVQLCIEDLGGDNND